MSALLDSNITQPNASARIISRALLNVFALWLEGPLIAPPAVSPWRSAKKSLSPSPLERSQRTSSVTKSPYTSSTSTSSIPSFACLAWRPNVGSAQAYLDVQRSASTYGRRYWQSCSQAQVAKWPLSPTRYRSQCLSTFLR